jgi:hypothetical protein
MSENSKQDSQRADSDPSQERPEHKLSDRVKRAVAAGLGAASRSKDDLLRAAGGEIGAWLERLDVQSELGKLLSKMVVEVKAEIRFRPREDGSLAPEATTDVKLKPEDKP